MHPCFDDLKDEIIKDVEDVIKFFIVKKTYQ